MPPARTWRKLTRWSEIRSQGHEGRLREGDEFPLSAENAFIEITFPEEIEYSYRPYALKEELIQLATQFAGISVGIYGFDPQGYYSSFGTGTMYDSYIKFFGYNLKAAARDHLGA